MRLRDVRLRFMVGKGPNPSPHLTWAQRVEASSGLLEQIDAARDWQIASVIAVLGTIISLAEDETIDYR